MKRRVDNLLAELGEDDRIAYILGVSTTFRMELKELSANLKNLKLPRHRRREWILNDCCKWLEEISKRCTGRTMDRKIMERLIEAAFPNDIGRRRDEPGNQAAKYIARSKNRKPKKNKLKGSPS